MQVSRPRQRPPLTQQLRLAFAEHVILGLLVDAERAREPVLRQLVQPTPHHPQIVDRFDIPMIGTPNPDYRQPIETGRTETVSSCGGGR